MTIGSGDNSVATSYTTNSLNQYASRTKGTAATYDANGNMTTGLDGSTYTYDAQNRVRSATKGGTTDTFKYDGMNRQISRKIGSASPTYNVYDGWDLIGEYNGGSTSPTNAYVYGATGVTKGISLTLTWYYYQDGSGSTSHIANTSGQALESYRYDLHGTPIVYDAAGVLRTGGSAYGIRHLFTGQQWYSEIGLYDLRNRFYSPDIGRFVQADPSGFAGDATNLYRYCGNNPLTHADPSGLNAQRAATMMRAISIGRPTAVDAGGGDVDSGGGGLTQGVAWDVSGMQGFDMSYLGGVGQLEFEQGLMGFGPATAWTINSGGVVQRIGEIVGRSSTVILADGGPPMRLTNVVTVQGGVPVFSLLTVGRGNGNGFTSERSAAYDAIDRAIPVVAYRGGTGIELAGTIFANSDWSYGYTVAWSPYNYAYGSLPGSAPTGTTLMGYWVAHTGAPGANIGPAKADLNLYYALWTGEQDGAIYWSPGLGEPAHRDRPPGG